MMIRKLGRKRPGYKMEAFPGLIVYPQITMKTMKVIDYCPLSNASYLKNNCQLYTVN
jgi:hypothetical protein